MRYLNLILMVGVMLLVTALRSTAAPEQTPVSLSRATSAFELANHHRLLETLNDPLQPALQKAATEFRAEAKIQKQIEEKLTARHLVPLFIQRIARLEQPQPFFDEFQQQRLAVQNSTGSISGEVTVAGGAALEETVRVLAFDAHGYFAAATKVSAGDTAYTLEALPAGNYYVLTYSRMYVNEIYPDVQDPLSMRKAWRQAQTVAVIEDGETPNINFELQPGARIYGNLTGPDGESAGDVNAVFWATAANDSAAAALRNVEVMDGKFEFYIPLQGQVKIGVQVQGYQTSWYPNASTWQQAGVVNVPAFGDSVQANLQLQAGQMVETGEISGQVGPALLALVFAFDKADTTLAGLGFGFGLLNIEYLIENLQPGEYYLYADDYLGSLLGIANMHGQYYDGDNGSPDFSAATTVSVEANQTTENINFMLKSGGAIEGRVTNSEGVPLDSVTMVLVSADLLEEAAEPVLSRLDIQLIMTDFDGKYSISGLKSGSYFMRTLALVQLQINLTADGIEPGFPPGKHANTVVDEYYGNVHNVLQIQKATKIEVESPNTVSDINFELEPAKFFSGRVTAAADDEPIEEVIVAALDDTSGLPFVPFATTDSTGAFSVGPLPAGNYKLAAVTGLEADSHYLPEFYNNKRSFYDADVLTLDTPLLDGIDFELETAGGIQGFVSVDDDMPAGADSLGGMPVVAYHAENGKVASYGFVQFSGGYRIDKLLPGEYKVAALPYTTGFATTYAGGGPAFDSENSQTLTVNSGATVAADITLNRQPGIITGTVRDSVDNQEISGVFVGAYDASGHLVGYDVTGMDLRTEATMPNAGAYEITGLEANKGYYLRTVALTKNLELLPEVLGLVDEFSGEGDIMESFGGLPELNLQAFVYSDVWYPNAPAGVEFSVNDLFFQLQAYGLANENNVAFTPIFLPIPFHSEIPHGAEMVTSGQSGVDFKLSESQFGDVFTDVQDETAQPQEWELAQNYPNPFNPVTTIRYRVPRAQRITLAVFDIRGRNVATLVNQYQAAGEYSISFDASALSSGVYFYQLEGNSWQQVKRMLLLK